MFKLAFFNNFAQQTCLFFVLSIGAVELENLPLKKDALKELELPFEVKAGMYFACGCKTNIYKQEILRILEEVLPVSQ